MLPLLLPVVCLSLVPHAYIERRFVASMISRWKPHVRERTIVTVTGMKRYVRARIESDAGNVSGALVRTNPNDTIDLFLLRGEPGEHIVVCGVLWGSLDTCMMSKFRDVRHWYLKTCHDHLGEDLGDEDEVTLWYAGCADDHDDNE